MEISAVEQLLYNYKKWLERKKVLLGCLDSLEYQSRKAIKEPDNVAVEREAIEREIGEISIEFSRLEAALKTMPEKYSKLLIMRYVEGKQWIPISIYLGYSCEHVRKDLKKKALEKLGELLKGCELL